MKRIALPAAVAALCLVASCAAKKKLTADQYYHAAEEYYREGAYPMAIETFRDLLDQNPFSSYTEEAELRIAHAHYLDEQYIQAIAALTDFQRRHPTSAHLAFVGYELGMCYEKQMGTIDRDQSAARSAERYFQTLIQQYPDSPYAELAREELAKARRSLAEHELYVARFYGEFGNEKAAEDRSLGIVGEYPHTDAAGEALYMLAQIFRKQKDDYRAALAYASLVQQHPNNAWAPRAQGALKQLEPNHVIPENARETLLAASGYKPQPSWASAEPVPVPGAETVHQPNPPPRPPIGEPGPFGTGMGGGPVY